MAYGFNNDKSKADMPDLAWKLKGRVNVGGSAEFNVGEASEILICPWSNAGTAILNINGNDYSSVNGSIYLTNYYTNGGILYRIDWEKIRENGIYTKTKVTLAQYRSGNAESTNSYMTLWYR